MRDFGARTQQSAFTVTDPGPEMTGAVLTPRSRPSRGHGSHSGCPATGGYQSEGLEGASPGVVGTGLEPAPLRLLLQLACLRLHRGIARGAPRKGAGPAPARRRAHSPLRRASSMQRGRSRGCPVRGDVPIEGNNLNRLRVGPLKPSGHNLFMHPWRAKETLCSRSAPHCLMSK